MRRFLSHIISAALLGAIIGVVADMNLNNEETIKQ